MDECSNELQIIIIAAGQNQRLAPFNEALKCLDDSDRITIKTLEKNVALECSELQNEAFNAVARDN